MAQVCPLYPRKRTCAMQLGMSALGQKRTSRTHFVRRKLFYSLPGAAGCAEIPLVEQHRCNRQA